MNVKTLHECKNVRCGLATKLEANDRIHQPMEAVFDEGPNELKSTALVSGTGHREKGYREGEGDGLEEKDRRGEHLEGGNGELQRACTRRRLAQL